MRLAPKTWSTPSHITAAILSAFGRKQFCLDPCSPYPPTVPCRYFFTASMDGLSMPWHGSLVFVAPPYDRSLRRWIQKAIYDYQKRASTIVLLLPARFETNGIRQLE